MEQPQKIRDFLKQRFPNAKIIVQPNSYKGLNLKIIDSGFETIHDREEHVGKILQAYGLDLQSAEFRFTEFLTPEEDELFGTDMKDLEPADLPFWANVVAEKQERPPIKFREDSDGGKTPIVTFYSFKGGVGRSTALVATAQQLAKRGRRVILVDMDLEAPGLPELLNSTLDAPRHKAGAVELMNRLEAEEQVDVRDYLVEITENLYLIPAGEISPYYLQQLSLVNLERYYRLEKNPVTQLFEKLQELNPRPDLILVDARTGLADSSAPLLFHVSDMSLVIFNPHPQARTGIQMLAKGILSTRNRRELTSELRFVMSMIPPSDRTGKQIQKRGLEWVQGYVDEIAARNKEEKKEIGISADDLVTTVYYQEQIAYSTSLTDEKFLPAYAQVVDWVDSLVEANETTVQQTATSNFQNKIEILNEMQIQTGIAENQQNLPEIYVKTSNYEKAMDSRISLILGRKGTGKSALFRMLQEEYGGDAIPIRYSSPEEDPLHMTKDDLREIEEFLPERNWDLFWAVFVLIKICQVYHDLIEEIGDDFIREFVSEVVSRKNKVIFLERMESLFNQRLITSRLQLVFHELNGQLEHPVLLLWDGLDRDFGIEQPQKERRDRVIVGLFDFWNAASQWGNLVFKIFLRHDIWHKLKFNNKSHFYGRQLTLKWENMYEYYKTLLKQIYAGKLKQFFDAKYKEAHKRELTDKVEYWTEEQVVFVFNLLVSERMQGGRTAYTRNWVWSRLADGTGDHSPRYLFQLFDKAIDLERREHRDSPYDRSLIRPRMLVESLETVSHLAVEAVLEEYQEFGELLDQLKNKVVPFDAESIKQNDRNQDLLHLAYEVGFIMPYEKNNEGEVTRITVPNLYLKGLEMSRRGQA